MSLARRGAIALDAKMKQRFVKEALSLTDRRDDAAIAELYEAIGNLQSHQFFW